MILTREIEIKINESNYQYYDDLGYDVAIGEIIKIPIELMSKGSHYKIKCKSLKPNGEIEVFLNYKGEIRPCCFIGVDLDKHSLGGYNVQLKEIFNYDCNLNTNKLDNILDLKRGYFHEEIASFFCIFHLCDFLCK